MIPILIRAQAFPASNKFRGLHAHHRFPVISNPMQVEVKRRVILRSASRPAYINLHNHFRFVVSRELSDLRSENRQDRSRHIRDRRVRIITQDKGKRIIHQRRAVRIRRAACQRRFRLTRRTRTDRAPVGARRGKLEGRVTA